MKVSDSHDVYHMLRTESVHFVVGTVGSMLWVVKDDGTIIALRNGGKVSILGAD